MVFDPEETGKLLLSYNPLTQKNPDKYLVKQPVPGTQPPPLAAPAGTMPAAGNGPLASMGNKPQSLSTPAAPQLTM